MKVSTKQLKQALQIVSMASDDTPLIPVASRFRVRTRTNGTEAEAVVQLTQSGIHLEQVIPADLDDGTDVLLDVESLKKITAALLEDGQISVADLKKGKAEISGKGCKYTLLTLPSDEYLQFNVQAGGLGLSVGTKALAELLDTPRYALPVKDHRQALLGLNLTYADGCLVATATDGKKLVQSRCKAGVTEQYDEPVSCGIHKDRLGAVVKILNQLKCEQVDLVLGPHQFRLSAPGVEVVINCIPGKYPDTRDVIPRDFQTEFELTRVEMLNLVAQASITASGDSLNKGPVVKLRFSKNACHASSAFNGLGDFSGETWADYDGPEVGFDVDCRYFEQTFKSIPTDKVMLHMKSPTAPIVFRSIPQDNNLWLIMPIKPTAPAPSHEQDSDNSEDS